MCSSVRCVECIVAVCLALAAGCNAEPTVTENRPPLTVEGQELLNRLEGRWSLQVAVTGNCPSEWRRALPSGQAVFTVDGGVLQISALGSDMAEFTFFPVNADTLMYSTTASMAGCSLQESAEFVVESVGASSAQGVMHVDLKRSNTPGCDALLDDADLPEACSTSTAFMGVRISMAPRR